MNVECYMRRLNRLLLSELGDNPPYAWIHSESAEFMRPMRAMTEDGDLLWNYRCPCGLNVAVHSAECVAGCLIVVEPVWSIRKTDPELNDQWVLCCLQIPMTEAAWLKTFGTILPYPANGSWAPVATETHTVAMHPGSLPGETLTLALIRARQRSREIKDRDIANAATDRDEKKDKVREIKIRERLQDCLPVNPNPGSKHMALKSFGGDDSLPSPALRRKIEQGESLVTV